MSFELSVFILGSVLGVVGCCSAGLFPASGKLALAIGLVPPAGFGLSILYCWSHPLAWLGPSLMLTSPPLAFGFAIHAFRRAADRPAACLAMGVAGMELIGWLFLCVSLLLSSLD